MNKNVWTVPQAEAEMLRFGFESDDVHRHEPSNTLKPYD